MKFAIWDSKISLMVKIDRKLKWIMQHWFCFWPEWPQRDTALLPTTGDKEHGGLQGIGCHPNHQEKNVFSSCLLNFPQWVKCYNIHIYSICHVLYVYYQYIYIIYYIYTYCDIIYICIYVIHKYYIIYSIFYALYIIYYILILYIIYKNNIYHIL
jgi:hypothetical protein